MILDKRKLKKIERIEIGPDEFKTLRKIEETEYEYRYFNVIKPQIKRIDEKEILILNIFSLKNNVAELENRMYIYIDESEQIEYTTFDLMSKKWRTSRLKTLYLYTLGYYSSYYVQPQDKKIINRYLKEDLEDPIEKIKLLQDQSVLNRRNDIHKKEKEKIDKVMHQIEEKSIPEDFESWSNDVVTHSNKYIFYEYSRKVKKEAYCTNCNTLIKVKHPKYGKTYVCPNCKAECEALSINKFTSFSNQEIVHLIQSNGKYLVIRYFEIRKRHTKKDNSMPDIILDIEEFERRVLDIDTLDLIDIYYLGNFKNTGEYRWCKINKPNYSAYWGSSILYTNNLKQELKDTKYKYSGLEEYAKEYPVKKIRSEMYLKEYLQHNQLEFLVKLGFYKLAQTIIKGVFYSDDDKLFNINGTNFETIFNVEKKYMKELQRMNPSLVELNMFRKIKKYNIKTNNEEFKFLVNIAKETYFETCGGLYKKASITKVYNYIKKIHLLYKQEIDEEISISSVWNDYIDYLEGLEKLDYDIDNVMFPRNFIEAHDKVSEALEDFDEDKAKEERDKKNDIIKKLSIENRYLEFKDDNYIIITPKSTKDIKREGRILRHCVATYIDNIAEKKTYVMFVRRKEYPNRPFYTVEIKDNEIKQVRGFRNKNANEDIKVFIEKFKEAKLVNKKELKEVS